jgi:DNA-directed RNA polymerase specialized sigma24 family protein
MQKGADSKKLDARAWAADEQADAFLDGIRNNTLPLASGSRYSFLKNLSTNRAQKYRRRARLLREYQLTRPEFAAGDAHEQFVVNETVARIQEEMTEGERVLLTALADGDSYASIASTQRCTESALKSRILRCRRRVLALCA